MKDLISSLKVAVTSNQMARLQQIQTEDFSDIVWKVKADFAERGVCIDDAYLERGLFALRQYYAVAMLDPANAHAVSAAVDPFWHTHILFTEKYFTFCERVVGEYMHHTPLDHSSNSKVQNVRTLYGYTLDVLARIFDGVDATFWPASVQDAELICYHKGNQAIYRELQADRLFEPTERGATWAYA